MSQLTKDVKFCFYRQRTLRDLYSWFRPKRRVWFVNYWPQFPNCTSSTLWWRIFHDYCTAAAPTTSEAWDPAESTRSTRSPIMREEKEILPHQTEHTVWPGRHTNPSRTIPVKTNPIGGLDVSRWPVVMNWVHHIPFSTPDLLNRTNNMPVYCDGLKKKKHLLSSIFTIHNHTWADEQHFFNTLVTSEEHHMVLKKLEKKLTNCIQRPPQ